MLLTHQNTLDEEIRQANVRQLRYALIGKMAGILANAYMEGMPKEVGWSIDPSFVARATVLLAGAAASETMSQLANWESLDILDAEQAKTRAEAKQGIKLTTLRQDEAILPGDRLPGRTAGRREAPGDAGETRRQILALTPSLTPARPPCAR